MHTIITMCEQYTVEHERFQQFPTHEGGSKVIGNSKGKKCTKRGSMELMHGCVPEQ